VGEKEGGEVEQPSSHDVFVDLPGDASGDFGGLLVAGGFGSMGLGLHGTAPSGRCSWFRLATTRHRTRRAAGDWKGNLADFAGWGAVSGWRDVAMTRDRVGSRSGLLAKTERLHARSECRRSHAQHARRPMLAGHLPTGQLERAAEVVAFDP